MNSRPLTYVSDGMADLEPLTPSMFLQDNRQVGVADVDNVDANSLSNRAKYRQRLMKCLRRRFRTEYLGQILQRPNRGKRPSGIAVGDVVHNQTRLFWPLARVERLIPGQDGEPRIAMVRTATTQLMRPLQRLYPLEISSSETLPWKSKIAAKPSRHSDQSRNNSVTDSQWEDVANQFPAQ
ncbi:hypothetical protein TTRE_0000969501 [Trichuris trichiura]|uniref:DUF5641 domain-containing protein n=1 Tax=Trichuris trichiura TaxID=36087 RepID=A0A077ZN72_TRITR|nr:hypothetical protein TTRE_0000969501 [Trichuris trichiura]